MAHLTCEDHKKRVVVLENGRAIHRNGEGKPCEGRGEFFMGKKKVTMLDIHRHQTNKNMTIRERVGDGR